jgi:hypothetical protein
MDGWATGQPPDPFAPHEFRAAHEAAAMTVGPQAERGLGVPDLGYYYTPLDWCWSAISVTDTTLTLTNGVAVGVYGTGGFTLGSGARLISEGRADQLNRLVRYHAVQEQPWVWGSSSWSLLTRSGGVPEVQLRFTDVSLLAGPGRTLVNGVHEGVILRVRDSQLRGVALSVYAYSPWISIELENNLVQRAGLSFYQENLQGYYSFGLVLRDNLFRRGSLSFTDPSGFGTWLAQDNLFDCDAVGGTGVTASHNGYRSGLGTLGGTGNVTGLAPNYQAGPLGGFYYPTTGGAGTLTNLFDAGSRSAAAAGLYHFSTRVDQQKEGASAVDIGYHYVARNRPRRSWWVIGGWTKTVAPAPGTARGSGTRGPW